MTKAHYNGYTLDTIADMRDLELSRLQIITEILRDKVREQYADGVAVTDLSRKASVTRRTIQQWIE